MLGWVKYLIIVIGVMTTIIFSGVLTSQHTSNTRVAMEVDGAMKTAILGESRLMEEDRRDNGISKEEIEGAIIGSISQTQKNHGRKVEIDYVLLDKGGNPTEEDGKIMSVQYQTTIYSRDNSEIQSKAVKRLSLDIKE